MLTDLSTGYLQTLSTDNRSADHVVLRIDFNDGVKINKKISVITLDI